jgi:CysZ protein
VDQAPAAPEIGSPVAAFEAPRPGRLRRAAAGAWHVAAGFGFLLRRPSLWPLAILPSTIALACLLGGLVLAVYAIHGVEGALVPNPGRGPRALSFFFTLVVWMATLSSGLVLGLGVALLLSAPILERLSRQVDAIVRGEAVDRSRGLRWELWQSFRGMAYFLAAAPGVFLLALVPIVGPVLAALWGAYALAFQQTDAALARRGLDFAGRRAWHRYWKAESVGFGLAGLVTLIVPFANFLVAPVLAVGGTLMVLELEDQLVPPDVPPPQPEA